MEKRDFSILVSKFLPQVKKNVNLANFTTFKIGGESKFFLKVKTKKELIKALLVAKRLKLPFFILGGGSNILVSDEGFSGLVIKFGEPLSFYVNKGLDWAVGIPGTLQGAVYGNAGAFGFSMADFVKEVEVFDIQKEKIKIFKNKDCQFDYRESIFKKKKNLILLSVKLKTKKSNPQKRREYLEYRKKNHPSLPSAGCIFKNIKISSLNKSLFEKFPVFSQFKNEKFIPCAFLISECNLKGKRIGKVEISKKHPNFIVNLGGGKAKDVLKLINLIKKRVKEKFQIQLEEEIEYLGF